MPKKVLFAATIAQKGMPFIAYVESEGNYDDSGEWIGGGVEEKECVGIILPLAVGTSNVGETLTYAENGVYSLKDLKLLTTETLPAGTKVLYKEREYTIQDFKDFSDYTDVNIYLMRWRERKE